MEKTHVFFIFIPFVAIFLLTDTNPIVSIIRKHQPVPVLFQSGVIITEKHVITVFIDFKISNLYVLAGNPNLKHFDPGKQKHLIYTIANYTEEPKVNLAILKLNRNIEFLFGVSRAVIGTEISTKYCHMAFMHRTADVPNFLIVQDYDTNLNSGSIEGPTEDQLLKMKIEADKDADMMVCYFDRGTPAFCNYGLVGLLTWPNCTDNGLCETECVIVKQKESYTFDYINIFTDDAKKLLEKYEVNTFSKEPEGLYYYEQDN